MPEDVRSESKSSDDSDEASDWASSGGEEDEAGDLNGSDGSGSDISRSDVSCSDTSGSDGSGSDVSSDISGSDGSGSDSDSSDSDDTPAAAASTLSASSAWLMRSQRQLRDRPFVSLAGSSDPGESLSSMGSSHSAEVEAARRYNARLEEVRRYRSPLGKVEHGGFAQGQQRSVRKSTFPESAQATWMSYFPRG